MEWLCAELLDLIPLRLLSCVFSIVSAYKFDRIFDSDINVVFSLIAFLYLLLKDCWGGSLGKRIMGITISRN